MFRICALLALLALPACTQPNPEAERAAFEATAPWLAVMDAGDYAQCWADAAPLFRDEESGSREDWLAKAKGYRDPLGAFKSRELNVANVFESPWGAPAGLYAVVVYDSHWEKGSIFETVNMQQQSDGSWLVAGYQVKQQ